MQSRKEKAELISQKPVFRGYNQVDEYQFRHTLFQGGRSPVISREVFDCGNAGCVLPYDPKRDEVVLIRQFRAGAYVAGRIPWVWQIIGGAIEKGEPADDLVRREAVEEGGLTLSELLPIYNVMMIPGALKQFTAIYVARADTAHAGGVFGLEAEGENILVKAMPFAEARAMLDRGEIDDIVAIVAIQWLALHRDEVRKRWR